MYLYVTVFYVVYSSKMHSSILGTETLRKSGQWLKMQTRGQGKQRIIACCIARVQMLVRTQHAVISAWEALDGRGDVACW